MPKNQYFSPDPDKVYLARCQKELKNWGLPLSGWECGGISDVCEDDDDAPLAECELCGCSRVRFVHHMFHPACPLGMDVGCVCAGVMEGNLLAARERERQMRNRAKRRRSFIHRPWKTNPGNGVRSRTYRHQSILLIPIDGGYMVRVDGQTTLRYKGKSIENLMAAAYAAFEMADPASEVMKHA